MSAAYLHSLFGLDNHVAVVIGGTGVLGGAICEGLAKAGAKVIISGRGPEQGAARAESIKKAGGQATFIPVEVTERSSIEELLAATLNQFGRVDILINCAGANSASSYVDVTDEDWDRVLSTNLTSTHMASQIFSRQMIAAGRGGAIVNIGSVTADLPLSRVFAYSASKAAVVNLTRNVARELAPHNIRVNALCPGFFPAEQNRSILSPERTEKILGQTPMARFGRPEELIGAVLLLVAPIAGSFITGAAYYVDGGFTAMRL